MPSDVSDLMLAYLVMRDTGLPPWEFGQYISRQRLWQAARILAPVLTLLPIQIGQASLKRGASCCPLLGE
jgi:hypothetical protein